MVNILDHIIHLSAPGELQRTVERFKDLGFRLVGFLTVTTSHDHQRLSLAYIKLQNGTGFYLEANMLMV